MFGYHDSSHCAFDIWSPDPDRWGENAIENRAFSPYCKHMMECEYIVQAIRRGETRIDLDDDFDESDLQYISGRCAEYGLDVNLTLN